MAESVQQLYLWAADRAGVGLGVEPTISRVVVLSLALGAHLEVSHGGHGPVVGHRAGYSEPRTAVGAVGERIPVASVRRVKEFREAVLAGGDVWRDQGPPPNPLPALLDTEISLLPYREGSPDHSLDHGQRWSLFAYILQEAFQLLRGPLRLDVNSLGVVAHQP